VTFRDAPAARLLREVQRRRLAGCVMAAIVVLTFAASPANQPAGPATDLRYGARAADAASREVSGLTFDHALEAGTSIEDAVEIINYGGQPVRFEIYGADLVPTGGGGAAPAARDEEVVGAGAWVRPTRSSVAVAPYDAVLVPFTLSVPLGTVPGRHEAALLVEPVLAETSEMIVSRSRVSLRVQIEVLGAIDLGVDLGPLGRGREGRAVTFRLPVTNTGNVTFVAGGVVSVVGGGDEPLAEVPFDPTNKALAPEVSGTFTARWDDAPWFGRVIAQPVIDVDVGDRPPVQFVGDPVTVWLVPWPQVLFTLGLAAALAALLLATRDPRHRWWERRREERQLIRDHRARRELDAGMPPDDRTPVGTG
jgi:hypothetical protein